MPGVRPEQADGFARALLGADCGPDDERRTAALVGWLLERAALQGHTAQDASDVRAALAERAVTDPDAAVQHAIAEGVVLVFQEGLDLADSADPAGSDEAADGDPGGDAGAEDEASGEEQPVQVLLGLDRYALAEESLADGLARLIDPAGRLHRGGRPSPGNRRGQPAAAAAPVGPGAAEDRPLGARYVAGLSARREAAPGSDPADPHRR